jgi:ankyrin repeat protein
MASFGLGQPHSNNTSQVPIDSSTPWMAASEGNLPLLQSSLSSLNLPLNAADENGYTLLHAAASYNQMGILGFLLNSINQVNVHAQDTDGDSALHYAGNLRAAQMLVEIGKANPGQFNNQGKSPLQAKQEELNEMMQDEDVEDDDEEVETLKEVVEYLSSLL